MLDLNVSKSLTGTVLIEWPLGNRSAARHFDKQGHVASRPPPRPDAEWCLEFPNRLPGLAAQGFTEKHYFRALDGTY